MTGDARPRLVSVGTVESSLTSTDDAPRQPDEGAPAAWVVLRPEYAAAADGLAPGDRIVLLTWLHQADRAVLTTHPRGDRTRPLAGVFATRSPARPNPIGLHEVTITERDGHRLRVSGLEAIDGTPVLDLKPVLGGQAQR